MRAERPADYDDRMDEDDQPRRPRRWGRFLLLLVLAVVLVAGGAWGWLIHGKRVTAIFAKSGGDGVPLVRSDPTPFKARPRDPGGMEVPDRDKLVYERLQGKEGEKRVERLLPPAEKPLAPPREAGPAPQVTERLPRVPTEAQVQAARPPAPPAIVSAPVAAPTRAPTQPQRASEPPASVREPEPEDSPPTAEETAPQAPAETAALPAPQATDAGLAPEGPRAPSALDAGLAPEGPRAPSALKGAPPPSRAASTPPASGFLIQIAAVREEDRAAAEWSRLQRQHPDALLGLTLFVIRADLGDKGVFWRLRAGPFADEAQAKDRCADLAKRKVGCLVVKAEG